MPASPREECAGRNAPTASRAAPGNSPADAAKGAGVPCAAGGWASMAELSWSECAPAGCAGRFSSCWTDFPASATPASIERRRALGASVSRSAAWAASAESTIGTESGAAAPCEESEPRLRCGEGFSSFVCDDPGNESGNASGKESAPSAVVCAGEDLLRAPLTEEVSVEDARSTGVCCRTRGTTIAVKTGIAGATGIGNTAGIDLSLSDLLRRSGFFRRLDRELAELVRCGSPDATGALSTSRPGLSQPGSSRRPAPPSVTLCSSVSICDGAAFEPDAGVAGALPCALTPGIAASVARSATSRVSVVRDRDAPDPLSSEASADCQRAGKLVVRGTETLAVPPAITGAAAGGAPDAAGGPVTISTAGVTIMS
jgi:hypothetical protein